MSDRHYFSARHRRGNARFSLPELCELFYAVYKRAKGEMLFAEAFGYQRLGWAHPGSLGEDPGAAVHLALRKKGLWPVTKDSVERYSQDDVFDMVEFFYDHASQPNYSPAQPSLLGMPDILGFDSLAGRRKFREMINDVLRDCEAGWQLTPEGEVVQLPDQGFEALLEEELPEYDPENVEQRVETATRKFRARKATDTDKLDAIRDLAAVLEFLRPKAEKYFLTRKDDAALFRIANEFAIRHHDGRQKGDYSLSIWYNWIFYVYLATIHAVLRAIKECEGAQA